MVVITSLRLRPKPPWPLRPFHSLRSGLRLSVEKLLGLIGGAERGVPFAPGDPRPLPPYQGAVSASLSPMIRNLEVSITILGSDGSGRGGC